MRMNEMIYGILMQVDLKIFSGVAHDWSMKYKNENEVAIKSAEEHTKTCLDGLNLK